MKRVLSSKLCLCTLVVLAVGLGVVFASNVVIKPGEIEVDEVKADTVDTEHVESLYLNVDNNVHGGYVVSDSYITSSAVISNTVDAYQVGADFIIGTTAGFFPKIECPDVDPAYVLYDRETRGSIIERIAKHVQPEKQGGAAMFFNCETKRIEVYVASEGAFYDLQGKLLETLPKVVPAMTQYEDMYYLDPETGNVKSWKKPVINRYTVKEGYELDSKTGQFVEKASGTLVSKQEAVEIQLSNGEVLPIQ